MPAMATTDSASTVRRFAVACGVLSQYVKAAAQAPAPSPSPADGAAQQQLTIFYGGRVVVLDACTPARAAELIRYAAATSQGAPELAPAPSPVDIPIARKASLVDIPIARKASLQRFLSRRKDRSATAVDVEAPPHSPREGAVPPPAKKSKTDASWLALGSLGDMHAPQHA
jgi:jasmonate ZIM domain-containing protein